MANDCISGWLRFGDDDDEEKVVETVGAWASGDWIIRHWNDEGVRCREGAAGGRLETAGCIIRLASATFIPYWDIWRSLAYKLHLRIHSSHYELLLVQLV